MEAIFLCFLSLALTGVCSARVYYYGGSLGGVITGGTAGIIAGSVIGGTIVITLIILFIIYICKKKAKRGISSISKQKAFTPYHNSFAPPSYNDMPPYGQPPPYEEPPLYPTSTVSKNSMLNA